MGFNRAYVGVALLGKKGCRKVKFMQPNQAGSSAILPRRRVCVAVATLAGFLGRRHSCTSKLHPTCGVFTPAPHAVPFQMFMLLNGDLLYSVFRVVFRKKMNSNFKSKK